MMWDERNHVNDACRAFLAGDGTMESCLHRVIDTIGWRWGFLVLSYAWFAVLTVVQGTLIRLCCGRLRPVERGLATRAVLGRVWRSLVFLNVVLAPKDAREWVLWVLWFSSTGLLVLLETVGREHFEHVIDNPRLGVVHHLRALTLHAVVLYLGVCLAQLGWGEFVEWGKGPVGQLLLSPSQTPTQVSILCDGLYDYSDDDLDAAGGYGGGGLGGGECTVDFDGEAMTTAEPERGGTGFALLLLYDLAAIGSEVVLSALKYMASLVELSTRRDADDSAYSEDGTMEQIIFFTRLGQAILSASRTVYMFKSCAHCALGRKLLIRFITMVNGAQAAYRMHRAAFRVVLAREMDEAFPDASNEELKKIPGDESCAICLKTMTKSVKRLQCQHFFHTGCLRQYLNNTSAQEPLCPICRTVIPWQSRYSDVKRARLGVIGGSEPAGGDARNPNAAASTTTTRNRSTANTPANNGNNGYDNANTGNRGGDEHQHPRHSHNHNPLAFGPAVHRPPTPDGFSRAARGADSAVRMVRQMLRFGLTGGGGGVAAPGGPGAAVPGGRATRNVGPGREGSSPSTAVPIPLPEAGRRSGGGYGSPAGAGAGPGGGSFDAVANQLLEIFPDMEWNAAMRAARRANGSTERAVEFALSSDNSGQGAGAGAGVGSSGVAT